MPASIEQIQEAALTGSFPVDLQKRFEYSLMNGELARGMILQATDLSSQFNVPRDEMLQVLVAAQRKGLVLRCKSDAPALRRAAYLAVTDASPRPLRCATGLHSEAERAGSPGDSFQVLGLADTCFVSVFTHTARSGFKPRSRVRAAEVEPANAQVAAKLEVEQGSPVYRYERTRYVDDEPLANQINYMPFEVCPGLEHDDVTRYSFQKLLEEKYHTVLCTANEAITIIPASEQDREVLGLPAGASILLIDRIALSPTGWPVVWASIRIRPDRVRYVAELWPEAAKLLKSE